MTVRFYPVWGQSKALLAALALAWLGVALASNVLMQSVPDRTESNAALDRRDPFAALASVDEVEKALQTVHEQAVFFADRRIPTAAHAAPGDEAQAQSAPDMSAGDLTLYGTFVSESYSGAILGGGALERPTLLTVGERIGNVRVMAISRGTVALEGPNGRTELTARPINTSYQDQPPRSRKRAKAAKIDPATIRLPD